MLKYHPCIQNPIGVSIFQETGKDVGNFVLLFGSLWGIGCVFASLAVKRRLKKEKLY